jgi:predicted N-acetyltransferase YhbS
MTEIRVSEAREEHLGAVAQLCGVAFTNADPHLFARMREHDPHASESVTIVARDGLTMVATVRIFSRRIRWQGRTLRLGGIGNVATHPEHRGRGHAAAVMRRAVELMDERGFEISLLFSDLVGFYEKFGFAAADQPCWTVPPEMKTLVMGGHTVRDFDWGRDVRAVDALHGAFNAEHDGTVIRDRTHWIAMGKIYKDDDNIALVAENEGEIVAHTRVMKERHGPLRLHEISARDTPAAMAVLAETTKRAMQASDQPLVVTLPAWPEIERAFTRTFEEFSHEPRHALMWRGLAKGPPHDDIMHRARAGELYFWAGDRI